jgi:hypothetical protein
LADLITRMHLAGDSLMALLDPEHELMPTGGYEVAHDLGRWWDAVLRLEDVIGFQIPAQFEAASLSNLNMLTDNPDRLLMNSPDHPFLKERAKINPHNFRESLLAFGGLVRRRNSVWARHAGLQLVQAMDRCLQPDGKLDLTELGSWGSLPGTTDPSHSEPERDGWFDGTATSGRALEALVWFYEVTGEDIVLDTAQRIAKHHFAKTLSPDGHVRAEIVDPVNVGHDHSYLGTLRGLLRFGLLTDQKHYIDAVESTYRNGVRNKIVTESGWAPHDLGETRFPNEYGDPVSDPASTGDAAQLALWLALEAGCTDLLDDVERYVRARIIPVQSTHEDVQTESSRSWSPREIGAWAIHGSTHGGKGCTPDVLAAVTHSLCDIYSNICTSTQIGPRVNLHFDYEDSTVRIVSERKEHAQLRVLMKSSSSILIRIPRWTPVDSVCLRVGSQEMPLEMYGDFARIRADTIEAGDEIVMKYDLPVRSTEEVMQSGRTYEIDWRGDEITGLDPVEGFSPFYPSRTTKS